MMQLLPKGGGDETSPARPSAGHVGRRAGSHRFFRSLRARSSTSPTTHEIGIETE